MIFIIDDERLIAHTLRLILERVGYRCEVFHDGAEALTAAVRLRPKVLISDVAMERMNGLDLAEAVTSLLPGCSIMLMSGHLSREQMTAHSAAHGWMVMEKPFRPTDLLRWVERLYLRAEERSVRSMLPPARASYDEHLSVSSSASLALR